MKTNKVAVIIRGPVAVGKTTTSQALKQRLPSFVLLSIDVFRHMIASDSSESRTRIARNVGAYFLEQVIADGYNIILEEVFHDEYYDRLKAKLLENDYNILTIFLTASKDEVINRNMNREKVKSDEIVNTYHDITQPGEGDVIISTSENTKEQTVEQIVKQIGF